MKVDNREIATFEETCVALKEALTNNFYQWLVKHCIVRLNSVFHIRYNLDKGLRGIMVEDMIQETLESLIKEGGRNWYKDKFSDIRLQVISSLDSVIFNTVSSNLPKENITFEIFDNDGVDCSDNEDYNSLLELCHEELKLLNATEVEIKLFEPYILQGMKRETLSDLYGISLEDLTNIKKRLNRKLPLLKEKIKEIKI